MHNLFFTWKSLFGWLICRANLLCAKRYTYLLFIIIFSHIILLHILIILSFCSFSLFVLLSFLNWIWILLEIGQAFPISDFANLFRVRFYVPSFLFLFLIFFILSIYILRLASMASLLCFKKVLLSFLLPSFLHEPNKNEKKVETSYLSLFFSRTIFFF